MKTIRFLLLGVVLAAALFVSAAPTVTITGNVMPEGDGETTGYLTFNLSEPSPYDFGANLYRLYVPPGPDEDWARVQFESGVTIPAGQTSGQMPVHIFGNDSYQSKPKIWNAIFSYGFADGTYPLYTVGTNIELTEDDPIPVVSAPDIEVLEGDSGMKWVAVTFTADAPVTGSFVFTGVHETTSENDCIVYPISHPDYPGSASPLTFYNTNSQTMVVGIAGDTVPEADETFHVELTNPYNLILDRTTINGTILNDDDEEAPPAPVVNVAHVQVVEGDSGFTEAVLTFEATSPIWGAINWATFHVTAMSGSDYQDSSGTVQFNNSTTAQIAIPIMGDAVEEEDEVFRVDLNSSLHLTRTQVYVTILNDDDEAGPSVVFTPASLELYAGEVATVTAHIDPPRLETTDVQFDASGNAAMGPGGVLVPPGGEASFEVTAVLPGITSFGCGGGLVCMPLSVEVAAPVVEKVTPHAVPTAGDAVVMIRGIGFSPACSVSLGDGTPVPTTFIDRERMRGTAPPHAVGVMDLRLTCGGAQVVVDDALEYVGVTKRRSVRR